MLDELRVATRAIIDHHVIVIAHRARQHDVNLAAQCGVDQAIQERVVGGLVRSQQELALRTTTGDQVELTRKHLTWKHPSGCDQDAGQVVAMGSHMVGAGCCPAPGQRPKSGRHQDASEPGIVHSKPDICEAPSLENEPRKRTSVGLPR